MSYIYPTFLKWENHKAYYKAKIKDITIGQRYCNCIYYNDGCRNACSDYPGEDPFWQECSVWGDKIDNGGKMYQVKLYTEYCSETELDWSYMQIPFDPDIDPCEFGCQESCEVSCQVACEYYCQSHCQTVCQTSCEVTCQTACQLSSEFCGRECNRGLDR